MKKLLWILIINFCCAYFTFYYSNNNPEHRQVKNGKLIIRHNTHDEDRIIKSEPTLEYKYQKTIGSKPKGEIACSLPDCDGPAIRCTNNNSKCSIASSECTCLNN